jgi:hypothetical protein
MAGVVYFVKKEKRAPLPIFHRRYCSAYDNKWIGFSFQQLVVCKFSPQGTVSQSNRLHLVFYRIRQLKNKYYMPSCRSHQSSVAPERRKEESKRKNCILHRPNLEQKKKLKYSNHDLASCSHEARSPAPSVPIITPRPLGNTQIRKRVFFFLTLETGLSGAKQNKSANEPAVPRTRRRRRMIS